MAKQKFKRGGTFVGPSHAEGGIDIEIKDTGNHVEVEGDEASIPRELGESSEEYTFTGTNREILNEILKKAGLKLSDKATEVKSGDIVICIKSTWDDKKRTYKGTIRQILSAINESGGCKVIEEGAEVTPDGGVEKKAKGGKISASEEKGEEDEFKPGTIVSHKAYYRAREQNYEIVEFLGFETKNGYNLQRYSAFPVSSSYDKTTGARTEIAFEHPFKEAKFGDRGWRKQRDARPLYELISKSAIETENRRASQESEEVVFEGKKPVYLMTKEEYKKEVTPLFKALRKFISKNDAYLKKKDYYGVVYETASEYAKREGCKRSHVEFDTAPDEVVNERDEFMSKFSELFGTKCLEKIQDDEANSPKRSINRAMEDGMFEKMILEGKINYVFLSKIYSDAGLKVPKKLESLEAKIKTHGYADYTEGRTRFIANLKERFKAEVEYYIVEDYTKEIAPLNRYESFYNSIIAKGIPDEYKNQRLHYILSRWCHELGKPAKLIQQKTGGDYVEYCHEASRIKKSRYVNGEGDFIENWQDQLMKDVVRGANEMFDSLAISIIDHTDGINKINNEIPRITDGDIENPTHRGFICNLTLVYSNKFEIRVTTDLIIAGGYNIQIEHWRYLFKMTHAGKRISQDELILAYKEWDQKNGSFADGGEIGYPKSMIELLSIPKEQAIGFINKVISSDKTYVPFEGSYDKHSEQTYVICKKFMSYDKNNPLITAYKESVYFEPDEELIRREGRFIGQVKYAAHQITHGEAKEKVREGIRKRFYDEKKVEEMNFVMDTILFPDERAVDANNEFKVYYLKKITHKQHGIIVLKAKVEINKNGRIEFLSLITTMPNKTAPHWKNFQTGENKEGEVRYALASPYFSLPSDTSEDDCPTEGNTQEAIGNSNTSNGTTNIDENIDPANINNEKFDVGGEFGNKNYQEIIIWESNFDYYGDEEKIKRKLLSHPDSRSFLHSHSLSGNNNCQANEHSFSAKDNVINAKEDGANIANLLTHLYKEHHESFADAERWDAVTMKNYKALVKEAIESWDKELEHHFAEEEETIFPALIKHNPDARRHIERLVSTHQKFREELVPDLKQYRNVKSLINFSYALKNHIVDEERVFKQLMEDPFCPITRQGVLCPVKIVLNDGQNVFIEVDESVTPSEVKNVVSGKYPDYRSFTHREAVYENVVTQISKQYEEKERNGLLSVISGESKIGNGAISQATPYDIARNEGTSEMGSGTQSSNSEKEGEIKLSDGGKINSVHNNSKITKHEIRNVLSGISKVASGDTIQATASYLRRSKSSMSKIKDPSTFDKYEIKCLKQYITDNNLWYSTSNLQKYLNEGSEQKVYMLNSEFVIKTNDAIYYNFSWKDYLNNLILHNYFFPKNAYELLGFTEIDGRLHSVVRQPFVLTDDDTDLGAVEKYMHDNGFVNIGDVDYYNPELNVYILDLHPRNVLTKDGVLFFINTVFRIKKDIYAKYKDGGEMTKTEKGISVLLAPNGKPSNLTSEQYRIVRTPEFKAWFGDWENDPENASKVVDENGEPKIMYHGSLHEFTEFKEEKIRKEDYDAPFNGFWFSADKETSPAMVNPRKTYMVFLNIRNVSPPNIWKKVAKEIERLDDIGEHRSYGDRVRHELKKLGYDGVAWELPPVIDAEVFEKEGKVEYKTAIGSKYWIEKDEKYGGVDLFNESTGYLTGYYDIPDLISSYDTQYVAFSPNQIKLADGTNTDFDPSNPDIRFSKGGSVDDNQETYNKWKELVNMSRGELESFYNSKEGKEAGLTSSEAKEAGINSGRESARWIMKMKDTPHSEWTPAMWKWANKQISFISRMSGNKGGLYDDKGNKTRKHTSLLIWGHNPEKAKKIMKDGGDVQRTPEQQAQDFLDRLSPEKMSALKESVKNAMAEIIIEQEKKLANLEKEKELVSEDLKANRNTYSLDQRQESHKKMAVFNSQIIHQKNVVQAMKNFGIVIQFTDKKGKVNTNIPDFSNVNTDKITFDEETILTDPKPPYIPEINEETFSSKGYVFDAIRIAKDQYIVAVNGFKEVIGGQFSYRTGKTEGGVEATTEDQGLVVLSLDQLVLTNDYYFTKAKAVEQKRADEHTAKNLVYYDNLPVAQRERHLNQPGYYRALPAAVKKKVTEAEWNTFTLEQKEAWYKPIAKGTVKRLTSKLQDDQMWKSFHYMYERYVNPEHTEAKGQGLYKWVEQGFITKEGADLTIKASPSSVFGHPAVFEYWKDFRDMMKWKILDIRIQREMDSDMRKIALETSFGDSNTNDILKEKYGILVKRQDGSEIMPIQIEQVRNAWVKVQKTFGGMIHLAKDVNLKISHTALKHVFASKAIGMYIPQMKTIAVSVKYGEMQFESTMAHEVAHWIDNTLGGNNNKRWASDDFESTAGIIARTFRSGMNKRSDSDYTNATKECFARAMEQYYAIENHGDDATLIFARTAYEKERKYFEEDDYVSKSVYESQLKPLIEKFIDENQTFFKYDVVLEGERMDEGGTVQEYFDLPEAKDIKGVDENILAILNQYASRKMANIQAVGYLSEIGQLGKDYLKENSISNKEQFDEFLNKKQVVAREGKGKERSSFLAQVKSEKQNKHLSNIERMALEQDAEWQKRIEYSKMADGGNVPDDRIYSSSGRFKPYETIVFDPPILGSNGAKLISYTWAYEWVEDFNDRIGENIQKRISDWTQAEMSADTGKNIVHKFTVQMPDGTSNAVSSESVLVLLGLTEREKLKSFPSLVNALKTLAKQKMQLAIEIAKDKQYKEALEKWTNAPKPEIKEESYRSGDHGGYTTYTMGDALVMQADKFVRYNEVLHKSEYEKLPHIEDERKEALIDGWIRRRLKEEGLSPTYGVVGDLKKRIERQERKVKQLSEETGSDINKEKKMFGGAIGAKTGEYVKYGFFAKDNKWRFEFSDDEATISGISQDILSSKKTSFKLSTILHHPLLYKYYPEFENIQVFFLDLPLFMRNNDDFTDESLLGDCLAELHFNNSYQQRVSSYKLLLYLNPIKVKKLSKEEFDSIILERFIAEVQHAVQLREGFGAEHGMSYYMQEIKKEIEEKRKEAIELPKNNIIRMQLESEIAFASTNKNLVDTAYERYRSQFLEEESRESASRIRLSEKERMQLNPEIKK